MPGWIERLSDRRDGFHAELRQDAPQLLERQIDTLDQDFGAAVVFCGLDRAFKVVDDRQQFLQELFVAESDLVSLIPLGEPLIILEFGCLPEILVVEGLNLLCLGSKSLLNS